MVEGEPWVQSDHMLFVMNQTPAMAITSEPLVEVETSITHTPKDRPDLVDCDKLVHVALALRDLLLALDKLPA